MPTDTALQGDARDLTDASTATGVDWLALARKLQQVQNDLIHRDEVQRYGDEFYAEALRRTFLAGEHPRAAELPYEMVSPSTGLMTIGEHRHTLEGHTVIDRLSAEAAKKEAREARVEARRVLRDAARDLAKLIRDCTNERTVPAKFRREGVLLAADWIDPDSPATPWAV